MQCQLLYILVLIVAIYASDYDYQLDEDEDSLACEKESDVACNLINRLIKGTSHKSIGMQLLDTVEKKELLCARSVENQRKEFSKKIGIVREALRVMNDTVNTLTVREKKLELAIKSKQEQAVELRNKLNNLNTAANKQNAQVLAEKRSLEAELATARKRILELETELDKVKRQKKNIENEVKNLSNLNKSLVNQNFELLNQTATACTMHVKTITDLETQVEGLKQQQDLERDTCNAKLDELEVDVKKCGVENENTNFNLEQCKKGEDILNLQLQNLNNEVKDTKILLNSVKSECKRNEEMFKEKEQKMNENANTLQLEAVKCKAEKLRLENENKRLSEQNLAQNKENAQLLAEKSRLEAEIRKKTEMKPIPKGSLSLASGKYFLNPTRLTWSDARQYCTSQGRDLVSIESEEENGLLASQMRTVGASYGGHLAQYGGFAIWTSGCYSHAQGEWLWQSNGRRVSYSKWDRGQEYKNHGCIILWANDMKWWPSALNNVLPFICE